MDNVDDGQANVCGNAKVGLNKWDQKRVNNKAVEGLGWSRSDGLMSGANEIVCSRLVCGACTLVCQFTCDVIVGGMFGDGGDDIEGVGMHKIGMGVGEATDALDGQDKGPHLLYVIK